MLDASWLMAHSPDLGAFPRALGGAQIFQISLNMVPDDTRIGQTSYKQHVNSFFRDQVFDDARASRIISEPPTDHQQISKANGQRM